VAQALLPVSKTHASLAEHTGKSTCAPPLGYACEQISLDNASPLW
jgi:hypothetical protein